VVFKVIGSYSEANCDINSPLGPWPSNTPNNQLNGLVPSGNALITLKESWLILGVNTLWYLC